jgi:ethanolamine utilization protein EutN
VKIARVVGRVWATAKDAHLEGRRILIVRALDERGEPRGETYLAVDSVDAGFGERVLVLDEGNSAGQVLSLDQPPIRTVVVGIVDEIRRGE